MSILKSKTPKVGKEELKPFWMPLFLVLAVFLSGSFLVWPKLQEALEMNKKIRQDEKKLAKLTAKVATLEGFDEAELSRRAEKCLQAIPSQKDVPLMISTLKALAKENDLDLFEITVDPGEIATGSGKAGAKEKTPSLKFRAQVEGGMPDLKSFFLELGESVPVALIEKLSLRGDEGDQRIANLDLVFPYLYLPEGLGAVEKALSLVTPEEEEVYKQVSRLEPPLLTPKLIDIPVGKQDPFNF